MGAIAYSTIFRQYFLMVLPAVLVFFFIVTNLVHAYLLKVSIKSGSRFTSQYLATSFIKMFFYLAVAIIYSVVNKENAKIFLINFLLLYAVYTTLEVVEFSKVVRQKDK
jgi:phosphotransferase system  glucose/maltose/N-acetylglucosamine-specific IIC component